MRVTEAQYSALLRRQGRPANTRTTLPCPSEAEEQEAVITWARCNVGRYPALEWLYHTPNGGARDKATAAALQRAGVQPGVPDLFLPVPHGEWAGLWIELKRADRSNAPTPAQWRWLDHLRQSGYMAVVCYGADETIRTLVHYLTEGDPAHE